jgi:hypothetical protein
VKRTQDELAAGRPRLRHRSRRGRRRSLADWVTTSADDLGGIDIVVSNVSAIAIPDEPENWIASSRST